MIIAPEHLAGQTLGQFADSVRCTLGPLFDSYQYPFVEEIRLQGVLSNMYRKTVLENMNVKCPKDKFNYVIFTSLILKKR